MTGLAPSLTERHVITPIKGESVAGEADRRTKRREKAAAVIALVKALGGATAVAAQLGSSRSAVTNWYTSGIPAKFWLPLSQLATACGVDPDVARLALPRVAAERAQQWDPVPRLAAVIQAVETATTLPDLMSCLTELDRLNDEDQTRAPYPEQDNDWTNRWCLAEEKVLQRIAGLRPETADQAQTLFKLMAARIEDDVIERDDVNQYIWSALMTAHECLWSPATAAAADADPIRTCNLHPSCIKAYNLHGGDLELEKDPLWKAYEQSRDAISDFVPQSIAGMLAKAHAAKAEAANKDGTESPDGTMAATWSWDLVNDLIRLFGTPEVVASTDTPPQPAPPSPGLSLTDVANAVLHQKEKFHRKDQEAVEKYAQSLLAENKVLRSIAGRLVAREDKLEQLARATPAATPAETVLRLMFIGAEMGFITDSGVSEELLGDLRKCLNQLAEATGDLGRMVGVDFSKIGMREFEFGTDDGVWAAEGGVL